MEFRQEDWLGRWESFEHYINSEEAALCRCWEEGEKAAGEAPLFKDGVRAFWRETCSTLTPENSRHVAGWTVTAPAPEADGAAMTVTWHGEDGPLAALTYRLHEVSPKALEGKPNFLFEAVDGPADSPFAWILAMKPSPSRDAVKTGGYLSHSHFQYGARKSSLLTEDGKMVQTMWYPTMYAAESELLDRCNVVRALLKLPKWTAEDLL